MIGWATEIKVRAERRTGELLREMEKHKGNLRKGKSPQSSGNDHGGIRLSEIGITKNDSSTWQKLAKIPEPEFEQRLETLKTNSSIWHRTPKCSFGP